MEGGPSPTYVSQPSLSAEEEAEKALLERAEWIHDLFPLDTLADEADPSLPSSQRREITSEPDGMPVCPPYLATLPTELIENIVSCLDNRAIKSLRLTCRRFAAIATLRINRVFLSANSLNIQVFRAIADDDILRHRIIEIIYDDARLWRSAADAADAREPNTARLSGHKFHPIWSGFGVDVMRILRT